MTCRRGVARGARRTVAGVVAVMILAGACSEPDADNASAPTTAVPASTGTPEPSPNVAGASPSPLEPDYADDAGKNIQEFDYPDDPEPAESIVRTLCNLNQEHFEGLRTTVDGHPVVDENLRTVLVGLSDLLGYWDTLVPHYPESTVHIGTARQIYELWDEAVLSVENGQEAAAQEAMTEAEELLEELPDDVPADCTV